MNKELENAIYDQLLIFKSEASLEVLARFSSINPNRLTLLCHFGLGLYIRNNYLHPKSRLYELFIADGTAHKDDMSGAIIRMWHELLIDDKELQLDINNNTGISGEDTTQVTKHFVIVKGKLKKYKGVPCK